VTIDATLLRGRLRWDHCIKPENVVSVAVVLVIACLIGEFARESEQLERAWHALGEGPARGGNTARWTDFNL
jgi:hypothetical protein